MKAVRLNAGLWGDVVNRARLKQAWGTGAQGSGKKFSLWRANGELLDRRRFKPAAFRIKR